MTTYTVLHPLVVEVPFVLFLTQPVCIVQKENKANFYQKRMKEGVHSHHGLQTLN